MLARLSVMARPADPPASRGQLPVGRLYQWPGFVSRHMVTLYVLIEGRADQPAQTPS
ncbi:MAG: hypothetical protein ACRDZ8_15355 [Acidimicrobiales bacterium]